MSIESSSEAPNIYSENITQFAVGNFLKPYLDVSNGFLSETEAAHLQSSIPQIFGSLLSSVRDIPKVKDLPDIKLSMGGSSMEVFFGLSSAYNYWGVTKLFKNTYETKRSSLEKFPRVFDAFKALAQRDADIDMHVEEVYQLGTIFDSFHQRFAPNAEVEETTNQRGQKECKFRVDMNGAEVITYLGPAYEGSKTPRLYVQLNSSDDKPLFHVDILGKELAVGRVLFDRREKVGTIHDNCKGVVDLEKGEVAIDLNIKPKLMEPSKMRLNEKADDTLLGILSREMRKQSFRMISDKNTREKISVGQLFPLMTSQDVFEFREIFSGNRGQKILDRQLPYERKTLLKEICIMAQIDPFETFTFLVDTGFDKIFFGRHLTRSEYAKIMTSVYLRFEEDVVEEEFTIERIDESRRIFLNYGFNDERRNGFECFASAVGEVFGPDPRDFANHFENGLNVINWPNLPEPKFVPTNARDKEVDEMYEAIQDWGSFNDHESYLYKIFSEKYHNYYGGPNGQNRFNLDFMLLRLSGALKPEVRRIDIDGKEQKQVFYYPVADQYDLLSKQPSEEDSEMWSTLASALEFDFAAGMKMPSGFEEKFRESLMENFGLNELEMDLLDLALIQASKIDSNGLIAHVAELVSKALETRKRLATLPTNYRHDFVE